MLSTPIFTANIEESIAAVLSHLNPARVAVVTGGKSHDLCLPHLKNALTKYSPIYIALAKGEADKNIDKAQRTWGSLINENFSRSDVIVNVGGGVVCDFGGFVAALYKRGMRFVNIPTSLLCAVDASFGGKTGVNFNGLKNQIGVFAQPCSTLIYEPFFQTLDFANRISGFAEILKCALISSRETTSDVYAYDIDSFDSSALSVLVRKSVQVKLDYIAADPRDEGIRHALNFGHTFGHAFEALAATQGAALLHGHAVAWGMVAEGYLSMVRCNFAKEDFTHLYTFVKELFSPLLFNCKDYDQIYNSMKADKKNTSAQINCVLLKAIGDPVFNNILAREEVLEALDFIREI